MHLYCCLKTLPLAALLYLTSSLPLNCAEVAQVPEYEGASTHAVFKAAFKRLKTGLRHSRFTIGSRVFLRIFKMPATVELWGESAGSFELINTYPICKFSGFPGPKRLEGDYQSPEGLYAVSPDRLNPNSSYHLSFDIGYPNNWDLKNGHTGSAIMIHGGCTSSGCFAIGDRNIEELYLAVSSAFNGGQETVPVHIFPFALTTANLQKYSGSPWIHFWRNLAPAYNYFEQHRKIPPPTLYQAINPFSLPSEKSVTQAGNINPNT